MKRLEPGAGRRCEVIRMNIAWDESPEVTKQCLRGASFIVNGVPMCKQHASIKALGEVLESEEPHSSDPQ